MQPVCVVEGREREGGTDFMMVKHDIAKTAVLHNSEDSKPYFLICLTVKMSVNQPKLQGNTSDLVVLS